MRDIAKEAYEAVPVGAVTWIRPDPDKGVSLASFQAIAAAVDGMQQDGLILIRSVHKESTSGQCLIDAIQFHKVR